ncbi:MAG: cupin domain-containing protein [Proteobacteria bacterium]|nr:cupin domain-containing protein [Burkholderiales bacterium]
MNVERPVAEVAGVRARRVREYEVFRIHAGDSNKFALIADPIADPGAGHPGFVSVIEIFDVGGRTPPNTHQVAVEGFFVLHGEGVAIAGDRRIVLRKGDSLLVYPGHEHVIENTGATRLYCLTTMVPDESFAALIRGGVADRLDMADLAVLES